MSLSNIENLIKQKFSVAIGETFKKIYISVDFFHTRGDAGFSFLVHEIQPKSKPLRLKT